MCAWAQKTADEYANLFNEHLNAGLQSSITMTVDLPLYAVNTQVFTLTDTVTGGPAGYVYNGYMITDSAQVDSATMILKEGIRQHPNRLDLYFGLATTYLYIDQPDWMIGIVEEAMKQSKETRAQETEQVNKEIVDTDKALGEAKLEKKNLDMICANNLKVEGAGFEVDTNVLTLITASGEKELGIMSKADAANILLSELMTMRI